ncbi:hypothetical protein D9M68_521520 [compost metagenome]
MITREPTPLITAVCPAWKVLPPNSNWVTVRLSPSTSLSLLSTLPETGVSSVTEPGPSLAATGASLTGFTPMVTVMVSVPPLPSSTMAVKLSLPLKSPFGV